MSFSFMGKKKLGRKGRKEEREGNIDYSSLFSIVPFFPPP
jgi:hypothetical protein